MSAKIFFLDETPSTNSYIAMHAPELHHGCAVVARTQTAGRGQRGNSWEAEPGKNLTMSVVLRPEGIDAPRQFLISEAVALAVANVLRACGVPDVAVKWPNDIYSSDRKICGILIEHVLCGRRIERTIAGIGLNVNQMKFYSDAPNPVSMAQLTGREFNVAEVAEQIRCEVVELMLMAESEGDSLHCAYMDRLWRRSGGPYPYRDAASGEHFMAAIDTIEPDGHIRLLLPDDAVRRYAFKEVEAIQNF